MTSLDIIANDETRLPFPPDTSKISEMASDLGENVNSASINHEQSNATTSSPSKAAGRQILGLGKKGPNLELSKEPKVSWPTGSTFPATAISPAVATSSGGRVATSPPIPGHPYARPASPYRHGQSTSPGLPSPASSFIFERDVQDHALPTSASTSIPSHITREDQIPPVLEASSLAITDDHQSVAAATTASASIDSGIGGLHEQFATSEDYHASNYGALDAQDVRRLSFVSFADVVHAEHSVGKEGALSPGLTPMSSSSNTFNRSPSPVYSRTSSQGFGVSSAPGELASTGVAEGVPAVIPKPLGSPGSINVSPTNNDLTVETMREALRKTGSADLGGIRSQPLSAVSREEFGHDVPWR